VFYKWLKKQQQLAERVVESYEAGCFWYEPARRMQALGVEVYVIAVRRTGMSKASARSTTKWTRR
jgi:hypothetical protein